MPEVGYSRLKGPPRESVMLPGIGTGKRNKEQSLTRRAKGLRAQCTEDGMAELNMLHKFC